MATIKLDREREVRLTLGAMSRFQKATGKNFMNVKTMNELNPDELIQLVYSCLGPKPDISIEEIAELVDVQNVVDVFTGIVGKEVVKAKDPLATVGPSSSITMPLVEPSSIT